MAVISGRLKRSLQHASHVHVFGYPINIRQGEGSLHTGHDETKCVGTVKILGMGKL